MNDFSRRSELALIVCFLGMIFAVPVTQTWMEVSHGERVEAVDVFCYKPTAANLRQFERTLEDKSWFQQKLRPPMQALLFHSLDDVGAKAIAGRDGWLFFRPDVRYLVEPDRPEPVATVKDSHGLSWVLPGDGSTRRQSVIQAIVRYRDLLKARDIQLVVMPVPGKPSVYPDKATSRAEGRQQDFRSPTLELLAELKRQGIETVDLFSVFRAARERGPQAPGADGLYLARDTHWTPAGAGLAARTVACKLRELGWAPPESREYRASVVDVKRYGDILEMTRIPGLRKHFGAEEVRCEQVRSFSGKLLIPSLSERAGTYKPPGPNASVLVLGDSFCRIYQLPEPQTLGDAPATAARSPGAATIAADEATGSKRLLPGSAGFPSLLMRELKSPVDYIVSDGGAASDVRKKLATNAAILEDKKVIVWEFVERDIGLGREGWEETPLPPPVGL
jgi:hypothetical protein